MSRGFRVRSILQVTRYASIVISTLDAKMESYNL